MTRVFLSHHKCGTTWLVKNISDFAALGPNARMFVTHQSNDWPAATEEWDYLVLINATYIPSASLPAGKAIHVIRNPLSIIVSAYFSHKNTHPTEGWPDLQQQREKLHRVTKRVGFELTAEFLQRSDFGASAVGPLFSLNNWDYDDPGMLTVRMEDLVLFPAAIFRRICNFLGEEMDPAFASVLASNSFSKITGGRVTGQTDVTSHYRSGSPVDWANHLSYLQAKRYYRRYRSIIDRFYPEVSRLFL